MSRAPRIQRLLQTPSANIISIEADGNCFYTAISKALHITIDLRAVVADAISINQLNFYKMLTTANVPGYERCAQCNTLEELQSLIRQPKVVWADQFSLETIVSHLNCAIWIIDDGAARDKFICVGGNMQTGTTRDNKNGSSIDVVLLHRTRRQHYNLVTINDKTTTSLKDMNENIKILFGFEETDESQSIDVDDGKDIQQVSTSMPSNTVEGDNEQVEDSKSSKREQRVAFEAADTSFNACQSSVEDNGKKSKQR